MKKIIYVSKRIHRTINVVAAKEGKTSGQVIETLVQIGYPEEYERQGDYLIDPVTEIMKHFLPQGRG